MMQSSLPSRPPTTPAHDAILRQVADLDPMGLARPGAVAAGTKLFSKKRVEGLAPIDDASLGALVRVRNGRRLEVVLELARGEVHISCSCSAGDPGCEHIVATVLAARSLARKRRKGSRVAAPAGNEALPGDLEALTEWAIAHDVADQFPTLSDLFVRQVQRVAPQHDKLVDRFRREGFGLGWLITGGKGPVRAPPGLRDIARRFLAERAEIRAAHRESMASKRWPAAAHPALQGHADALLEIQRRLAARGITPRPPDERPEYEMRAILRPTRLVVDDQPGRAPWYEGRRRWVMTLEHGGGVELDEPIAEGDDPRTAEALELALDALTDPGNAELLAALAEEVMTPPWQHLLDDLQWSLEDEPELDWGEDARLGWRLTLHPHRDAELAPVICTPKARGGWRLKKLPKDRWLDADSVATHPGDAAALRAMELEGAIPSHRRVGLGLAVALPALVGHPRLFVRDGRSDRHLRLRRGEVALATRDRDDGRFQVGIELEGKLWSGSELLREVRRVEIDGAMLLIDPTRDEATLCPTTAVTRRAIVSLGRHPDTLPPEAAPGFVATALQAQGKLPLAVSEGLRGPAVAADPRVYLRLELGSGTLAVAAVVKPARGLPSEVPGTGPVTLYAERDGAMVAVERDLAGERAAAHSRWEELGLPPADELAVELPIAEAFELVRGLNGREDLEVEWGGRRRLTVERAITPDQLTLEARRGSGKSWFSLHGDAAVDGGGVVPLGELLRAIRERQRYVRVDGDRWAEIDQALARRMSAIAKRDGQLPALMTPVVADLEDAGATLEGFSELRAALERLRTARSLAVSTPAGLEAALRPYQEEGFQWLARLAEWAPGACLADDMGLGKTVQAIALMLQRKEVGPSLVVAPTSLGFNWARELERFAPTLSVRTARSGADLLALDGLEPEVVVITSYGLAMRHVAHLAATTWGTLVVDEAQSLKNARTQRAQALCRISAGFVLALTGTPVENRAAELWSLFRLVAPGLLGTRAGFREDFAAPIERGDEVARAALAALIAPFVLRRLKRDVAHDLPERTEVEHEVVLGRRERERYEEIRRATLRVLDGEDDTPGPQRTFKALQALTRLRQLACHPALLDPAWDGGSKKLDALADLVERLREEGHKALVFSQFTSFLALARARLEALGAKILYLDGKTPAAQRQARVDAFQQGVADVFLLSLKAGGTGLNLTAATYVIHLDPWWNPAVEDQATDRTHRIGQEQPVTVYRLIAKDTVEEGIVRLHGDKRALADALLAGAGSSASLSYDEMVALIGGVSVEVALVDDEEADIVVADEPASRPAPDGRVGEPAGVTALKERLEAAVKEGAVLHATAANYLRVARRYLAFAAERGIGPLEPSSLDAYVGALVRGDVTAPKSDRTLVRTAYRWLGRAID